MCAYSFVIILPKIPFSKFNQNHKANLFCYFVFSRRHIFYFISFVHFAISVELSLYIYAKFTQPNSDSSQNITSILWTVGTTYKQETFSQSMKCVESERRSVDSHIRKMLIYFSIVLCVLFFLLYFAVSHKWNIHDDEQRKKKSTRGDLCVYAHESHGGPRCFETANGRFFYCCCSLRISCVVCCCWFLRFWKVSKLREQNKNSTSHN